MNLLERTAKQLFLAAEQALSSILMAASAQHIVQYATEVETVELWKIPPTPSDVKYAAQVLDDNNYVVRPNGRGIRLLSAKELTEREEDVYYGTHRELPSLRIYGLLD